METNSLKIKKGKLRKLLKNKNAVSQVLAAVMMIFMFTAAIGVVWAWLLPTYQSFQTRNVINSVTSYMLSVDNSIYDLLEGGEGIARTINIDSFFGEYIWEEGKNTSLRFRDQAGTYNETYTQNGIGNFYYNLEGRKGVILQEGDHAYLKGPRIQNNFFVNSSGGASYQGLTNLTMFRPLSDKMIISLDYRVACYHWYDQTNDVLSITVSIIQLEYTGIGNGLRGYYSLNLVNDLYETVYTASTTVDSDFYLDGSLSTTNFDSSERVISFIKPGTVINYDVNIEVVLTHISIYI
jgi:hypothetical protein